MKTLGQLITEFRNTPGEMAQVVAEATRGAPPEARLMLEQLTYPPSQELFLDVADTLEQAADSSFALEITDRVYESALQSAAELAATISFIRYIHLGRQEKK
jgi:hypothetical protein